jgi:hypothetical protein
MTKFTALILCETAKDELIKEDLSERLERHGIQSILHDETSVDKDIQRTVSQIQVTDFIVTPATLYPHPSFAYEIGYGQSKEKPILFISSVNGHQRLPDVFARQVLDMTFDRVQGPLVPLLNPGLGLFLNDLLSDNIHIQMLYGVARESLGLEIEDERIRGM